LSLIWNFFILNLPPHREKEGNGDSRTERVATEFNHLETVMNTTGTLNKKTNQITGNESSKTQFGKRSQEVGSKRDEKENVRTEFVAVRIYPISLSGSNT
jgi:endo-1,4-beta-D-glucanase Y